MDGANTLESKKGKMKLFTVGFERGEMKVFAADIVKETPQFFIIEKDDDYRFGFTTRIPKAKFARSEKDALAGYIKQRDTDRTNAQAVVEQATSQIAHAEAMFAALEEQVAV